MWRVKNERKKNRRKKDEIMKERGEKTKQNLIPTQEYIEFTVKTARDIVLGNHAETYQKKESRNKRDFKSEFFVRICYSKHFQKP